MSRLSQKVRAAIALPFTFAAIVWFQSTGPRAVPVAVAVGVLVAATLVGVGFSGWLVVIFRRLLRDAMAPSATDRLAALSLLRRRFWLSHIALVVILFSTVWVLAAKQPGDLRVGAYYAALLGYFAMSFLLGIPGISSLNVTWLERQDAASPETMPEDGIRL